MASSRVRGRGGAALVQRVDPGTHGARPAPGAGRADRQGARSRMGIREERVGAAALVPAPRELRRRRDVATGAARRGKLRLQGLAHDGMSCPRGQGKGGGPQDLRRAAPHGRCEGDAGAPRRALPALDADHVLSPRGYFLRTAAPPRPQRGYSVETSRSDAAATTWLFRGDKTRRPRGYDVDIQWRRVAAATTWIFSGDESPRLRRGYSVETSRSDAVATTRIFSGDESRLRRGYSVETSRGYDADIQWRRVAVTTRKFSGDASRASGTT